RRGRALGLAVPAGPRGPDAAAALRTTMAIRLSLPVESAPALRFPESLDDSGLLVGWSLEKRAPRRPIGFSYGDPGKSPATGYIDPVLLAGEGHLITIAPTGA